MRGTAIALGFVALTFLPSGFLHAVGRPLQFTDYYKIETAGAPAISRDVITQTTRFAAAMTGAGISNWLSDHGTSDIPGPKLVANWHMREKDETKRFYNDLPRLYNKHLGHDDNRDSLTSKMPETASRNRHLFIEWNPQLMHNHPNPLQQ